ncbi:MAG: glycoside hydrolase family 25 protein [Deltaproteobacteria bacterium]|nr:glycoside hydrolase family 25 protein [Deltaproteobacteria bacterium]
MKIISAIIVIVVLTTAALLYMHGYWHFNYPSKNKYPVRGIDVSHHQGKIDWKKVKEQEIHFAFIKATEGSSHKDTKFIQNWGGATNAGLIKGAYHYFSFCKPGIEQAQNYINTVPIDSSSLPPVIDFEFVGNCKNRPEKDAIVKELLWFIREVEEKYHKTPIIYVTYDSYNHFLKGESLDYPIWIRDIFSRPDMPEGKNWTFWQYTNRGRVKGINGPVDLNVFNDVNLSDQMIGTCCSGDIKHP